MFGDGDIVLHTVKTETTYSMLQGETLVIVLNMFESKDFDVARMRVTAMSL